jgi:hypothetical protein
LFTYAVLQITQKKNISKSLTTFVKTFVKENLNAWKIIKQADFKEKYLRRLRIGHTALTHKHLLERSNTPTCSRCNTPTTVKYILLDCPNLQHHREKNQIANNMTTILNTEPEHVIQYMRDCEIYHLL